MAGSDDVPVEESGSEDVFSVDRIRRLVELMKEHDLSEIDLRHSRQRIRLCRGSQETSIPMVAPMMQPQYAPQPAAAPPPAPSAAAASPADKPASIDGPHLVTIKSPMVGTLYLKANPKSDVFVKVGQSINPETTICIIEAMKVFNEIPAEVRGKVVEILCSNEEPVDFGKPLFKVDTRG